jgi:3-hydroxyisobutyrate dehydrogenase-like beta-hydroxyacid dehydrogenase
MSEVSVIGLGNMGSALARALLKNGRTVTVSNRSQEKAVPLIEMGTVLAPNANAAIEASPRIIVCVTNYAAASRVLDGVATNLAGKLFVQFTTGSPQDARASEEWAHEHAADYRWCHYDQPQLDRNIGSPHLDLWQGSRISKS